MKAPDLLSYDYVIVASSGGKDSLACVLDLLERGVPKDKLLLWHHCVDGREGSDLMDWPVTEDYCRKVAKALGLRLFFSWKCNGFEGEMLRENARTEAICFEGLDGRIHKVGGNNGKKSTRRKFPMTTASLMTRWCTAYLKIDVAAAALRNLPDFKDKRTLVVTGERAEESPCRADYKMFEPHKADLRNGKKFTRHVDHYRPVHDWPEAKVWEIIKRWKIKPHPCYALGWGRCSCCACIFGNNNVWASLAAIDPDRILRIAEYEAEFDCTIHKTMSVLDRVSKGTAYPDAVPDSPACRSALSREFTDDVFVDAWELPAGAFGENAGPS